MQVHDFRDDLHKLCYTAEMNQLYHQDEERRWWRWDKAAKIAVAVVALAALCAATLGPHWLDVTLAVLAAIVAVVLNVVPFGEWMTESGEMFRGWSDLVIEVGQLEIKVRSQKEDEDMDPHHVDRLAELLAKGRQLNADEAAPDLERLKKCQEAVNHRSGLSCAAPTSAVAEPAAKG